MKKTYNVIGLMSGTSLDGLDIAFCEIRVLNNKWEFDILETETVDYPQVWKQLLKDAPLSDGANLSLLNTSYGHWIGQTVFQFITKHKLHPRLIASHGHTIFHKPHERMTLQIGSGAAIAAETGVTTIVDFRSLDVALGGQGAPLVPIGDRLLFAQYDACVNIGGFANISMETSAGRTAWDICPANIVINTLANRIGLPYDPEGTISSQAQVDEALFRKLEDIRFYKQRAPKSLGREWVEKEILPFITNSTISTEVQLCTFTHHVASQISKSLPVKLGSKAIITGGGAHNTYLIDLIRNQTNCEIIKPGKKIIDYKEALVFALLGVLRVEGINNCLSSATGAKMDCCSGVINYPPKKALGDL